MKGLLRSAMAALVLTGCQTDLRPPGMIFMRAAATTDAGEVLTLSSFAEFPWQKVFVRPSSESIDQISRELGIPFPREKAPIEDPEDGAIFVLVDGNSVVYSFLLPKRVADCSGCYARAGFARSEAIFRVAGIYQGQPARSLVPDPP